MLNLVKELRAPPKPAEEEVDKKDAKKKPDPKKDAKKKGKKGEEEEPSTSKVIIPKIKITMDLIEEKSLQQFLKAIRALYMRTPKLFLLMISLEDAEELGINPEEVSLKFLEETINTALQTKLIFEKNYDIPEWADKMENELYPDEAVILFENICLNPVELGYEYIQPKKEDSPTEGQEEASSQVVEKPPVKYRCLYEDIKNYANVASQYGNVSFA